MEDSEQDLTISTGIPYTGLSFDQIAKAIGRNEVWLAAAFYGQVLSSLRLKVFVQHIDFITLYRPNFLTKSSLKFLRS